MSTIRAKFKKCRKYGSTIFEKCSSAKYAISEQKKRFAVKGKRRTMVTEYGKKLIEKQKIRLSYGLKEKNFVHMYLMLLIHLTKHIQKSINL